MITANWNYLLFGLINTLVLMLLAVRVLRWLAWVQQKEYRFDRLWGFMTQAEGRAEVLRLLPTLKDFSRIGLKRPVVTARLSAVALVAGLLISIGLWIGYVVGGLTGALLIELGAYVLVPVLMLVAVMPSVIAAQIITYSYLWLASRKLRRAQPLVIGIGGCYGKTSTKLLLHHVLSAWQPTFTTPKSFNTKLSAAKSIYQHYQGEKVAIIEYGTYTIGEIKYLAGWFPFQLGMETGFTEQHLQLFGSVANIIKAEGELGAALPTGAPLFCHAADEGALKIAEYGAQQSGANIIPYTGSQAVVQLSDETLSAEGLLSFTWQGQTIATQLVGRQYLANVAGVISVATHLGVPPKTIVTQIANFQPSDRFVTTSLNQHQSLVVDDGYAANPLGVKAALDLVAELKKKRSSRSVIMVFGGIVDLGDLSDQIHTDLAQQAKGVIDQVWYLGSVGLPAFKRVLGERVVAVSKALPVNALKSHDLILIEGRIPAWLAKELKK